MILTYLAAYAATAVVFLGLDYLWIAVLARDFYRQQLGPLMLEQPIWSPRASSMPCMSAASSISQSYRPFTAAGGRRRSPQAPFSAWWLTVHTT